MKQLGEGWNWRDLKIGDMAVWVGASAPHRDEAFRACRYIIDEIKSQVQYPEYLK